MRFWYTSFHLLQYLLYQEIGGGRMTDQTDIASLAFQWRHPPSFSFLILLHSSFLPAPPWGNWNLNSFSLIFYSFLKQSYFYSMCIYTQLAWNIYIIKLQYYFSVFYIPQIECMFKLFIRAIISSEIQFCASCKCLKTQKQTNQAKKQICSAFKRETAKPLSREAKVLSPPYNILSGNRSTWWRNSYEDDWFPEMTNFLCAASISGLIWQWRELGTQGE